MTPTPPPNTSASSAAISLCKIALMAGVVLIHSSVLAYLSPETATGWGAFLVTFISEGLASACVPLFYFLSGYLFFARWTFTWNGYKSKLRRRMWSLLVPYILWNCVGLLLFYYKATHSEAFADYSAAIISFPRILLGFWSVDLVGMSPSLDPFLFVFWFVRNLLVAIMLVPAVRIVRREGWGRYVWFIAVGALSFFFPFYGLPEALFCFSLGAALAPRADGADCRVLELVSRPKVVLPCAMLAIIVTAFYIQSPWYGLKMALMFPVGAVGLGLSYRYRSIMAHPLMAYISSALFFVYAFHGLWASVLEKAVVRLLDPHSDALVLVAYVLVFVIHWAVALGLFALLCQAWPYAARLLTGGRGSQAVTAIRPAREAREA